MARIKCIRVHQEMEIKRYKGLNWIGLNGVKSGSSIHTFRKRLKVYPPWILHNFMELSVMLTGLWIWIFGYGLTDFGMSRLRVCLFTEIKCYAS